MCFRFYTGPKNQSFDNNSRKPQPNRTKFGTYTQVKKCSIQEIVGAISEEAAKRRLKQVFLSAIRDEFSATSQQPIFTKCHSDTWIHVPSKSIRRNFQKCFHLGITCYPTPQNWKRSKRQLTQTSLQPRLHCRAITPRCSARVMEFPSSGQLLEGHTVS